MKKRRVLSQNKIKKQSSKPSHEQFLDEAGHYDAEKHANSIVCDHPNDFWPDEPR